MRTSPTDEKEVGGAQAIGSGSAPSKGEGGLLSVIRGEEEKLHPSFPGEKKEKDNLPAD